MKWLFCFLLIGFSCRSNTSAGLSADQSGLASISDNFKSEYYDANNTTAREKVVSNYELKLQHYLTYTCDSSLKNMKVRITTVEERKTGNIYAEFTDKHCKYVFHQLYDSDRQMKSDILYQIVKSLKRGTEITVRFLYAGNVKINSPENASVGNFEIEVLPVAIMG